MSALARLACALMVVALAGCATRPLQAPDAATLSGLALAAARLGFASGIKSSEETTV